MAYSFSFDVFYNIADALEIAPKKLLVSSVFPNEVLKQK